MLKNTAAAVNAVRYSVKGRDMWMTFVTENEITTENVAETAKALAVLAFPNDEQVQTIGGKRTRFGNAVQAAGFNLRTALADLSPAEDTDDDAEEKETVVNLLTRAGLKADLEDVIAAWKAAHENN